MLDARPMGSRTNQDVHQPVGASKHLAAFTSEGQEHGVCRAFLCLRPILHSDTQHPVSNCSCACIRYYLSTLHAEPVQHRVIQIPYSPVPTSRAPRPEQITNGTLVCTLPTWCLCSMTLILMPDAKPMVDRERRRERIRDGIWHGVKEPSTHHRCVLPSIASPSPRPCHMSPTLRLQLQLQFSELMSGGAWRAHTGLPVIHQSTRARHRRELQRLRRAVVRV